MKTLLIFIPILPLIGFLLNGIFGRSFPKKLVHRIAITTTGISFLLAVITFFKFLSLDVESLVFNYFTWIKAGDFVANFGFLLDPLSMVMVLVVTGVGFLIHVYSIGYMWNDIGYNRFFAYLNLFMFSMLILVLANNYLLLFVGWEGVGLCSYLLIGFYFHKKSASDAGKKAFIVNRIGDFGFVVGLMLIFFTFRTIDFEKVFSEIVNRGYGVEAGWGVLTVIGVLLFIGATGKSAQIPLYVWLPDAMEGPTPVSALIHAATMVTAGVYMITRSNAIYSRAPHALFIVGLIGSITALFAATIGIFQRDIKRVLAYSTVSQLGYMFTALGVLAFSAGIFHLMTHAFFKALLFLGSGSVILALHHEQDMQNMGGLKKYLPITCWTMWAATLAISGIPIFAGFFSKDEILWRSYSTPVKGHMIFYILGTVAALITALYMFRLMFLTFHGKTRLPEDKLSHVHESPKSMTGVLVVLAILSTIGGFVGMPGWTKIPNIFENFLEPVFKFMPHKGIVHAVEGHSAGNELLVTLVSILVAGIGALIAYIIYLKKEVTPEKEENLGLIYKLIFNKYYVDEIYNFLVVQPIKWFSTNVLWKIVDVSIIDGIVNGYAYLTEGLSVGVSKIQNGFIRSYVGWIALGGIGILYYILINFIK